METNDFIILQKQYSTYIAEIKRQLEEAKKQIERIPKLEEVSNMTLEEFCKLTIY